MNLSTTTYSPVLLLLLVGALIDGVNSEEFSLLYHDTALDHRWPFTANYYLADSLRDLSRTNDDQFPIGTTNFTFQPNSATNIPAPPIFTPTDPYRILQPAFHTTVGLLVMPFPTAPIGG